MGSELQFKMSQYRELRSKAERLRKKGQSYREILKKIPVSRSTMSIWCRHIQLTKDHITRLGSRYGSQMKGAKANQLKSLQRKEEVRKQALTEIPKLSTEMLKVAGALLYWAEGNKKQDMAITNSDPTFIVFYIKWLEKILQIFPHNLSAYIHLHQGQNEYREKLFWSQLTRIPMENFGKTFYKPRGSGHRKNILYHGTIRIRVSGRGIGLLRHRILAWVEAVAKQFVPQKIITIHYRGRMGR